MATLPNEHSRPLPRLAIFKNLSPIKKREEEAMCLVPFLLAIDQIIEVDDVEYGSEPPDFVIKIGGKSIGTELTVANPKLFLDGRGNVRIKAFKDWKNDIETAPQPEHRFTWGTFTLRESLEALKSQFEGKIDKVKRWPSFDERWLIFHLGDGGPFSDLVATNRTPAQNADPERLMDHTAKVLFEVSSILSAPCAFDYIFMFSGARIVAFPKNGRNPYRFPMPRWDLLTRGARVEDSHLDWKGTLHQLTRRTTFEWPITTEHSEQMIATPPKPTN